MLKTPFAEILRVAVEKTPGAIGGAFAASDGECVDFFSTQKHEDWMFLTAHYGVILAHIQAALKTYHWGEANFVMIEHTDLDILIHSVDEGYYAVMAVGTPAPLAVAIKAISRAADDLRKEMGL